MSTSTHPSAVGSQIQLMFQVKFPTFTPDQFGEALKQKGFTISTAQASNPQGQTMPVQVFSKGNLVVFILPIAPNAPPQLAFQILNTIDLVSAAAGETSINDDITQILRRLNIVPEAIASISFTCTTMIQASDEPAKGLASMTKTGLLQEMAKALGVGPLSATSLRIGTVFPIEAEKKGFQLIIEPLATNPKGQYFVSIVFKTDVEREYSEFISQFGENIIQNLRKALGE